MHTPDRRSILRAGGALVGMAALAGCQSDDGNAGDDGAESNDGDSSSDEQALAITNVTLTDGEPSGYQQFTEVDSTTFEATETVWLYFEPTGFERESVGDGEVTVELEMGLSVTGPDGEQLYSAQDTLARTSPEDGDVNAYFSGNFQPPISATGGEYTATLTLTDAISGEAVEQTTAFTIETSDQLAVNNVTFLEGQPRGYRDFDTQADPTYTMLDPIWVYFEPVDFATESAGNGVVRVDLVTEIAITDPSGREVYTNEDILGQSFAEENTDDYFAFWNASLPAGLDTGEYTATVSVEDRITGQTASATETFSRELASDAEYAQAFRTTFESTLDITDITLASGNPVELVYESSVSAQTESAVDEIMYIAGVFASTVGRGWQVTGLVASVTGANGTQYSYQIDSETAVQFITDEITAEEYREVVLSTVEQQ